MCGPVSVLREKIRTSLNKYTKDFEITPVVILLSVPLLATLRYYNGRAAFFNRHLAVCFKTSDYLSLYRFLFFFLSGFVLFFLVPISLIYLIPNSKPSDYGLKLGRIKVGFGCVGVFFLFMLPILFIASKRPTFQSIYPMYKLAGRSTLDFVLYEGAQLLYFFSWEFFFRGYMLFGLKNKFGPTYAILIQTIPFVILHFGKPQLETIGAIFAGIALGALAISARSVWYGVILHWGVAVAMDVFVITYK